MINQESEKFWNPKLQAWLSLNQAEYLKSLAADQVVVVRETSQDSLSQWRRVLELARESR